MEQESGEGRGCLLISTGVDTIKINSIPPPPVLIKLILSPIFSASSKHSEVERFSSDLRPREEIPTSNLSEPFPQTDKIKKYFHIFF